MTQPQIATRPTFFMCSGHASVGLWTQPIMLTKQLLIHANFLPFMYALPSAG